MTRPSFTLRSLTLRGISHNLGETNDSGFTHALHKGLYFDYMMANPPVWFSGGQFILPEYGVSSFIVVQWA